MANTMDFEGTRGRLREQLEETQAKLSEMRDAVGELALDVELGSVPQSALDKARAEQTALTQREAELQAALEAVDEREADHKAAEAEKKRAAASKRFGELQDACRAAGAKVVTCAEQLAEALSEGKDAAESARLVAYDLGLGTNVMESWAGEALRVVYGVLGTTSLPPGELGAAVRALTGRE